MRGGLLELVGYGAQDYYLTGRPDQPYIKMDLPPPRFTEPNLVEEIMQASLIVISVGVQIGTGIYESITNKWY